MIFVCDGKNGPIIDTHFDANNDTVVCNGKCVCCAIRSRGKAHICGNCKYYAEYEGVCCYYRSEHVADFVAADDGCRYWRKKENA